MKRKPPIKRMLNKAYLELNAPAFTWGHFFYDCRNTLLRRLQDLLLLDGQT